MAIVYNNLAIANTVANAHIKEWTIGCLTSLDPLDTKEEGFIKRVLTYLGTDADHFSRHEMNGHLTASILITQGENALLVKHKKLAKWLQPGGHIDEGEFPVEAALRELQEEVGIDASDLVAQPKLLMASIHTIPARDSEMEHNHLDLRFHAELRKGVTPTVNQCEADDCQWFSFEALLQDHSFEIDLRRSIQKLAIINDFQR